MTRRKLRQSWPFYFQNKNRRRRGGVLVGSIALVGLAARQKFRHFSPGFTVPRKRFGPFCMSDARVDLRSVSLARPRGPSPKTESDALVARGWENRAQDSAAKRVEPDARHDLATPNVPGLIFRTSSADGCAALVGGYNYKKTQARQSPGRVSLSVPVVSWLVPFAVCRGRSSKLKLGEGTDETSEVLPVRVYA